MEQETCNWIRSAKLQIDVGAKVVRNIFSQNIRTSCLGEYKLFWFKTLVENQCRINFCSIIWGHLFGQFYKLDQATQEVLKPLIESLRSKSNQTLAKQVHDLKTWIYNIREKFDTCTSHVQEELLSWERQIQDEIDKLFSLLGILKDWNTRFLSLWNKYQYDLISKMQVYCDDFVSTSRSSLSNIRNISKDDLQIFSNTFEKDVQSNKEIYQNELMIIFKSWKKEVKALVKSWDVPEKTTHYDHILKDLVSEVKDNLKRLKKNCMCDQSFDSWYMNLKSMQASWKRQIDHTRDSSAEIKQLAQTWQLNLKECPSYHQEQLKKYFLSEPVLRTLIIMWKHKILTDDQICKLTSPTAIPDLQALDTTCLLLLLRTSGLLQPPELGWQAGISDTDLSAGADLLRLESYRNDMIRDIQNLLIPKERFQQVEDVLSRLASYGGKDFLTKIKTDIDKIKTCLVEELLVGHFKRVVINSCKRAIQADVSGLSLSGRSMTIGTTIESYLAILRSLLYGKWWVGNSSEEFESTDVGNWTSKVDASSKDCGKYQRHFLVGLLENLDVRDTNQIVPVTTTTCRDFGAPLSCISMTTEDVSQPEKMDSMPQTAKRRGEEGRDGTVRKRRKKSHHYATEVMTKNSAVAYIGKYDDENLMDESVVVPALNSTSADLVSEKVLELLRNDDYKGIEDLLREGKIPTKMTTITAVNAFKYKESVKYLLRGISDLLKKAIPNSTGAWCGYRPKVPDAPVFVVILRDRNCIFDEIPKPFSEYEIIMRHKHVPNKEERHILQTSGRKIVRAEDADNIHKCIAQNTDTLMREHSNLSIIRASPVKASGYLNNKLVLAEKTCLVFSVPVKGIIPIGEKEFQKSIDGIVTDIREGEFLLFGRHNANEYHSRLRMGCCVSRPETGLCGTLGGFVDLPGNKFGCLTAAHVVSTEDEIKEHIKMNEEMRKSMNERLKAGEVMRYMHQPKKDTSSIPFGKVHSIALQEGSELASSVDAAIIEITDYNRNPKAGNFPDGDFGDVGFTTDNPMLYTTGEILDTITSSQQHSEVIKFGIETGITRGVLGWDGTSARIISERGKYCFSIMYRQMEIIPADCFSPITCDQMEITPTDFANKGDSGALAFLSLDGDSNNLHAIGMVVGGNSTNCLTLITPITAIFQELALPEKRFRVFPNVKRLLEEHSLTLKTISDSMKTISESIKTISESIKSLEQKTDKKISSVREEIKESLKEFTSGNRNVNT